MSDRLDILFPVGRMVAGNMYQGRGTDAEGRPLVYKTGPNTGQPRQDFFFGCAFPKGPEQHWNQTQWGAQIWNFAQQSFPSINLAQPGVKFAFKVSDGDSQQPNTKGIKNCDREGYAGHWVVYFSSSVPPRLYNADGTQQLTEPNAVKPGYYIQPYGNIQSNQSTQQPGIYINHNMVALAGYGEEISIGPDASSVGFGGAALPQGASTTPVGGGFNPAPQPQATPTPTPAPAPVTPAHDFLNPPPGGAPAPAPAPRYMADGHAYTAEQLRGYGWTDAQIQQLPLAQ